MNSKIAASERLEFSARLRQALENAHIGQMPAEFIRAYNARADGSTVSVHAGRKWLEGESVPTHEKILILSRWLSVDPTWLQFGAESASGASMDVISEANLPTPQMLLLNDILALPEPAQRTIREIVDAFTRNFGK